jgi:hypothetical protein
VLNDTGSPLEPTSTVNPPKSNLPPLFIRTAQTTTSKLKVQGTKLYSKVLTFNNDMKRNELWVRLSQKQTTLTIIYASYAMVAILLGEEQFGKGNVPSWREIDD